MQHVDSTSAAPVDKLFHQTHREIDCVDYLRFSREIYPVITQTIANKTSSGGGGKTSNGVLDALIVWTQIRSFMKGSIDAILQGGMLSLNSYLDMAVFSKDRCRLQVEQRRQAYELFQRYERYLQEKRLWDDMDKIRSILLRALPVRNILNIFCVLYQVYVFFITCEASFRSWTDSLIVLFLYEILN